MNKQWQDEFETAWDSDVCHYDRTIFGGKRAALNLYLAGRKAQLEADAKLCEEKLREYQRDRIGTAVVGARECLEKIRAQLKEE